MDSRSAPTAINGNGTDSNGEQPRDSPGTIVSDAPEAFGSGDIRKTPEAFGRARPAPDKAGNDKDSEASDAKGKKNDPGAKDPEKQGKKPSTTDKEDDEKGGDKNANDEKEGKKPKGKPFYKRPLLMTILIASLIVLIIAGVIYYFYSRQYEGTDDAYIDVHEVPISPQVSANIQRVYVTDNQQVKGGDLMVDLDPTNFQVVLEQKLATLQAEQSQLDEARSHLAVAQADIGEARAEVDVAQTNADNADRDYNRFMSLEAPARSQQQLDNATAAYKGNHAQVEQAQAKLEAMKAQYADGEVAVATAQANVKQAQDDVKQAKVNLSYCKIYAPKDGLVTKLGIQAGSYATVGEVFFSIVPTDVYVTANYKETQLTYMKPGQPVTIKIDAYPDREWHGHVDSIQNGSGARFSLMPPENATGNYVKVVQRVPVKIDFDNENDIDPSGHLLEPGLSVEPTVEVR